MPESHKRPSPRPVVECPCRKKAAFPMVVKNVGITLLGVVVAVGAFVASNIWATSLHDKVERLTGSTDTWSTANKAVSSNEIDLNGNGATDLLGITTRLKHRIV